MDIRPVSSQVKSKDNDKAKVVKSLASWLWKCIQHFHFQMISEPDPIEAFSNLKREQLDEWLVHVDDLQNVARKLQNELAQENTDHFDWSLLGAATYLYHIDRLCVKVREHILTLRYLHHQFSKHKDTIQRVELIQAVQSCKECHDTSFNILSLLKKLPKNRLHCEILVNQIHALELENVGAASALRSLGQFVYNQEAFLELKSIQHGYVLQVESEPRSPLIASPIKHQVCENVANKMENLRVIANGASEHYKPFLKVLLEQYSILSRCYIIKRKDIISNTLNEIMNSIEEIVYGSQTTGNIILTYSEQLRTIYLSLQSLRFCANHSSRCSENLASKAKVAMHQFKEACYQLDGGNDFIYTLMAHRVKLTDNSNH